MCTEHPEIFDALAAEFHPDRVKRKQNYDYITARTVMNRLDKVLGPENWWDEYQPLEKSVICRLTIRLPGGMLLTKCDAGGYAGLADAGDDDKSGFSDAFKRAAVKFGIFRYGYKDGQVVHSKLAADAIQSPPPAVRRAITGPAVTAAQIAPATPARSSPPVGEVPAPRAMGGASPESPASPTPPARAGSEDAQGRGGKLAYGQSSTPRAARTTKPRTGEDLHYYCVDNTIDPNLANWVINSFNPMGYPVKLVEWTPAEVSAAWGSIREHLLVVKAARDRMKAAS